MTTTPDAPRPALGELARLAKAAMPTPPATNAWFTAKEFYANGYHPDFAAFLAACSPAVILQLVALATGGAETAKLREALEMIVDLTADEDDDGDPAWTIGQVRERAEAALTPERPADAR